MKLSKVYKVSGDVTVILFTNNDNNRVIKCKLGDELLVDPYEYKMAYVIDNEFGNVIELNEFFNEENGDGDIAGTGGGKMDLDTAGTLFKNLLGPTLRHSSPNQKTDITEGPLHESHHVRMGKVNLHGYIEPLQPSAHTLNCDSSVSLDIKRV